MTVNFERRTVCPAPIERVFDLSLDVDFHQDSMKESGESAIGGVRAGKMALGDIVTWRARHFGIMWTMTSKITEYDRPHMFVDEQHRGPFKKFHHEHRFTAIDDQTTELVDVIEFQAPVGPIGRVVERVLLRRHLEQLIDLRNAELVAALDA